MATTQIFKRYSALLKFFIITTIFISYFTHAEQKPYTLEGTAVHDIYSENLKRHYEIYISLPPSYTQTNKNYPVVFVTDAPYAFPLVRSIAMRMPKVEEFILVGLSYAKNENRDVSRNRDYTPTDVNLKKTREIDQGSGPYGQAEAYRKFIVNDVFPFIKTNYKADMNRKVYIGHSYGGLFGIHTLLSDPTTFHYYVLGSPSLWFDKRFMFDVENTYATTKKDMPAHVMLLTGSFEQPAPAAQAGNKRFYKETDNIKDMENFAEQLKSHNYPGLVVQSGVIADEDHLTVFPAIAIRGLQWSLPKK